MADDTDTDAPARKPFAAFLQEHKKGALADELAEQLQEVVKAVLEHRKSGSLTLKLGVAMANDGITLFITDDVTTKVPKPDRGGGFAFADENGNLHRNDPNQMTLAPLKAVPVGDGRVAHINADTGEVKEIGT